MHHDYLKIRGRRTERVMHGPPGSQTQNAIVTGGGIAHIPLSRRGNSARRKGHKTVTPFNLIGIASVLALGMMTLLVSVI